MCSSGPTWMMPALLTSTSMVPRSWTMRWMVRSIWPRSVRSHEIVVTSPPWRLDVGGRARQLLLVSRRQHYVRALARELACHRQAEPARPAEDHHGRAGEVDGTPGPQGPGCRHVAEPAPTAMPIEVLNLILYTSTSAAARGRAMVPGGVPQVAAPCRWRSARSNGGWSRGDGQARMQSPDPLAATETLGLCAKEIKRIRRTPATPAEHPRDRRRRKSITPATPE